VAGLARRVHDVSVLNQDFVDRVANSKDSEIADSRRALARRVPTRWNSDFDCLNAHVFFKDTIQAMTGVRANKLTAYRLDDEQWELADEILEVLKV